MCDRQLLTKTVSSAQSLFWLILATVAYRARPSTRRRDIIRPSGFCLGCVSDSSMWLWLRRNHGESHLMLLCRSFCFVRLLLSFFSFVFVCLFLCLGRENEIGSLLLADFEWTLVILQWGHDLSKQKFELYRFWMYDRHRMPNYLYCKTFLPSLLFSVPLQHFEMLRHKTVRLVLRTNNVSMYFLRVRILSPSLWLSAQ